MPLHQSAAVEIVAVGVQMHNEAPVFVSEAHHDQL